MAERVVEVRILKAIGLKNVNLMSPTEAYAVVNVSPYVEYTTKTDAKNGVNPFWDEKFGFILPETAIQQGSTTVMKVDIYTTATLGPKHVGEVTIPIQDILTYKSRNYPVKTSHGDFHGELHVQFDLGELVVVGGGGELGQHAPIVTHLGSKKPPPTTSPRPFSHDSSTAALLPAHLPVSHHRERSEYKPSTAAGATASPPSYMVESPPSSPSPYTPSYYSPTTTDQAKPSTYTPSYYSPTTIDQAKPSTYAAFDQPKPFYEPGKHKSTPYPYTSGGPLSSSVPTPYTAASDNYSSPIASSSPFASPLGRILLTDLSSNVKYNTRY